MSVLLSPARDIAGSRQAKKSIEIFCRRQSHGLIVRTTNLCQLLRHPLHHGRFIPFAAIRHRSQEGRIRLNQHAVRRQLRRHISDGLGLGKGDIAGEGNEKVHVHRLLSMLILPGKTVQHPTQPRRAPMLIEKRQRIVPGIRAVGGGPAVNQDRQLVGRGNLHLLYENALLHFPRRMVVEIVQTNLADRHHFRLSCQPIQLVQRFLIGEVCFVGMNSSADDNPRHIRAGSIFAAQIERSVHRIRTFANSDGQNSFHTGFMRAHQHRFAVVCVAFAVQMCMRVDQHGEFPTYLSRAPISTSSKNPARTGLPFSPSEAATIMPFDSRPRSFRGARFATITTLRPIRLSGV